MKTNPDNALDSLGTIGKAIRDQAPAKPDPVKEFHGKPHELISNQSNAMDTIAETLKKSSLPIVSDGQESDWEGICLDVGGFGLTPEEVTALNEAMSRLFLNA